MNLNPSSPDENPENHPAQDESPEASPSGTSDAPKFGRLLIVLILAVLVIVAVTFGSEAFYS